ncbi:MAG: methanogenesis marker protein Mmp4/MtxX [Promethearchaeota archaeon]
MAKKKKSINIGIGLGDNKIDNHKILIASLDFLKNYNSFIYFFGKKDSLDILLSQTAQNKEISRIKLIECQNPEKSIIHSLKENSIQAIVRGSLSSSKFLKNLKQDLNITKINRLAILETIQEDQFFYGPVGIDECNNLRDKIIFIESALKELREIEIIPKISILSGGRFDDIGREEKINQSLQEADKIVDIMKEKYPKLMIFHDEILIENAIENNSTLIVAPNGISGNLIYRTLVHLGGGKAYGAIYMGIDKTIIDTSRVGGHSEYYGALVLALTLSK